jgi:hypothetical protein
MRLITIKDTKAAVAELKASPKQSHRVGDSWVRAVWDREESVLGRVALEGKSAAHGQITERKYSVAQMAIIRSRDRYPDTGSRRLAGYSLGMPLDACFGTGLLWVFPRPNCYPYQQSVGCCGGDKQPPRMKHNWKQKKQGNQQPETPSRWPTIHSGTSHLILP